MAKILIIEDEEVLLEVLSNKLKKEGYEVIAAKDGLEGLEKMKSEKPSLILLDILMPRMNGFEFLETIRQDPNFANVPVIIISNSGQPVEIDRALKLGAKDYLVKAEFDPQEVLAKVKKQLLPNLKNEINSALAGKISKDTNINKLLIIEDDKFLRDLISQKLSKEGFEITGSVDGDDGLKKVNEEKPSLILLDLILPGIDGFEVLRRLKQKPETEKIPVVVLSNLGQKDDIDKAKSLGAVDYLIKAHFTPGEIVDKVKDVLNKYAGAA